MKVGIMQPTFFPWLGFFELLGKTDQFVFLDSVELSKQSWQTRNVFKLSNGAGWQTIPISGSSKSTIHAAKIDNYPRFISKLSRSVLQAHARSEHKVIAVEYFEAMSTGNFDAVADFNIFTIKYFADLLGIKPKFLRASDMSVGGERDHLIINILEKLSCDTYVASSGSRTYMRDFGIDNYPVDVAFFDYPKSKNVSNFHHDFGYENIMDILARLGAKEVCNNVF